MISRKPVVVSVEIFIIFWCLPLPIKGYIHKQTFDLHNSLLRYYDTDVVPRINLETINVNMSFNLMALLRFDETEETLITAAWLSIRWNDYLLKWDENPNYNNITDIFLQQKKIWKPDFRLVNTVETYKNLGSDDLLVKVKPNGNVSWEPGHRFKTSCSLDINLYPFDSQICSLIFSTWMHLDNVVTIFSLYDDIIFDDFEENGEWRIVSSRAESSLLLVDGDNLPRFIITLTLQRRTLYYTLTIYVPIIVLSILNCLVYLLPPDSGEKISFCLTVLLAYMVYISFLSDNLPRTSKTTSYLVVYLSLMICLSFLSVLNSVIVLLLWHKSDELEEDKHKALQIGNGVATQRGRLMDRNMNANSNDGGNITEMNGMKDGDVKSANSKTLARRLDKLLCVGMVILTVATTVIVIALLFKSKYSAKL